MIKSQIILQIFDVGYIWEEHFALPRRTFAFLLFFFFFSRKVWLFNQISATCGSRALFTNPQILLFSNFFIKNGFHDTIYIFKNYFTTLFFSFQFSAVSKQTHSQLFIGFHLGLPLISFFHLPLTTHHIEVCKNFC